jgi:hypothetical protein
MAAVQDHLIPAVDASDLVEQDYPAVQEIRVPVILQKELPQKLTTSPRAEADIARRGYRDPKAGAIADGATGRQKWKVTFLAPE